MDKVWHIPILMGLIGRIAIELKAVLTDVQGISLGILSAKVGYNQYIPSSDTWFGN